MTQVNGVFRFLSCLPQSFRLVSQFGFIRYFLVFTVHILYCLTVYILHIREETYMKHILRRILVICLAIFLMPHFAIAQDARAFLRTELISVAPSNSCEFLIECILSDPGKDACVFLETSRWIVPTPRSIRILSGETPIYEYSSVINGYVWLVPENERPSNLLPLTLTQNGDGTYILTWHMENAVPGKSYTLSFTASVDSAQPDFEQGTLYPACTEAYVDYTADEESERDYLFLPDVYIPLGMYAAAPQQTYASDVSASLCVPVTEFPATGDPSTPILFFAAGLLAAFCLGILFIDKNHE